MMQVVESYKSINKSLAQRCLSLIVCVEMGQLLTSVGKFSLSSEQTIRVQSVQMRRLFPGETLQFGFLTFEVYVV